MQQELMVFRQGSMVIAYGKKGNSSLTRQLPGYLEMTEDDSKRLDEVVDKNYVLVYFLAYKEVILDEKIRTSSMESPVFGMVGVIDPNGELPNPGRPFYFNRPALDGPVLGFPLETLPFILNALTSISAMTPSLAELSDGELKSLIRVAGKLMGGQR